MTEQMTTDAEARARAALQWAIHETVLRLPPHLRDADAWEWDAEDVCLDAITTYERWHFHVAGLQRGNRYSRIAVLRVQEKDAEATWEAEMPSEEV